MERERERDQLELVFQSFSSILSKSINLRSGFNQLSASFPHQEEETNLVSRVHLYSVVRGRERLGTSFISIAAPRPAHRTACFPLGFVPSSDAWFVALYAA